MMTSVKRFLLIAVSVYLAFIAFLIYSETSLVFPAPQRSAQSLDALQVDKNFVRIPSDHGPEITALLFRQPNPSLTLLFFHGNGSDLTSCRTMMQHWSNTLHANVMVYEYQGYGSRQGTPHETGIIQDGLTALRYLQQQTGVPASQLILVGNSLGGGVAVQVAKSEPPAALVLFSTFSSLVDVAEIMYPPWIPIRFLARNRFESHTTLAKLDTPLLQFHGTHDSVIPLDMGKRLFDRSPAVQKSFVPIEGGGHETPVTTEQLQILKTFCASLLHENADERFDAQLPPG